MYEKYSVLFVDDEVNILNSLRRSLLDEEYTCYFAETGRKAIEILETQAIQIVITDMRMPEINGLDLLKHIELNYPMVVKMVLSGYTQLPQVLATINQVDIFNFITKPWNIEELQVIIRKALDYYILQEDNANYKTLLETKNQSYQNILKRIDDVIDQAKKSAELLKIIGNEILGFSKDFTKEDFDLHYDLISKNYPIYTVMSKAATIDRKPYSINQLISIISDEIQRQVPNAVIDRKVAFEGSIIVNRSMLDAILTALIILFHDELTENGLYVSYSNSNRFIISIITPNAEKTHAFKKHGSALFNAKIVFIRNLVNKISDLCLITLQVLNKDGNLVIGFSFEEQ